MGNSMQDYSTQKSIINPNFLDDVKTFKKELEVQMPSLKINLNSIYFFIKKIRQVVEY